MSSLCAWANAADTAASREDPYLTADLDGSSETSSVPTGIRYFGVLRVGDRLATRLESLTRQLRLVDARLAAAKSLSASRRI